jgi:pilus assembly protein TadC
VYRKLQELNDTGEKRDEQLEDAYYSFVNRLAIHIGAGLNLRDAMRRAAEVERSDYLKKEVGFALNRVASGVKEASVYMDLGKSLGTQEYMRLMSLLSQNLAYGNSNLIGLLDSEVKQSFYIKREHIRKKGEQASEKLLLPTAILLVLVIVIVMYPAFINL